MPTFNLTVQLQNGEQITAPVEAWFLAIMKQFTPQQQQEVCMSAAKIAAEAITVPVARTPIPKAHQIINVTGITPFRGTHGKQI